MLRSPGAAGITTTKTLATVLSRTSRRPSRAIAMRHCSSKPQSQRASCKMNAHWPCKSTSNGNASTDASCGHFRSNSGWRAASFSRKSCRVFPLRPRGPSKRCSQRSQPQHRKPFRYGLAADVEHLPHALRPMPRRAQRLQPPRLRHKCCNPNMPVSGPQANYRRTRHLQSLLRGSFFRSVESVKPNEGRAKELTPCLRRGRPPLCAVQPGAISLGVLLVSLPP